MALPVGGLPEAHGTEFGQGARIGDECLEVVEPLVETSSPLSRVG